MMGKGTLCAYALCREKHNTPVQCTPGSILSSLTLGCFDLARYYKGFSIYQVPYSIVEWKSVCFSFLKGGRHDGVLIPKGSVSYFPLKNKWQLFTYMGENKGCKETLPAPGDPMRVWFGLFSAVSHREPLLDSLTLDSVL